jgi:hypothetical protein
MDHIDHSIVRAHEAAAKGSCAPVFWRKPNGRMTNGTVTFVRTPSQVLGVTNAHVADGLVNSDGGGWQLGGAQFHPNRLIDRHPTLDLATFELSDVFLATAGGHAATVPTWPPVGPSVGDPIMLGGYPGTYREQLPGSVNFSFAWFAGKVESVSETTIGLALNIGTSISTSPQRIAAHADLGGCSGGPVFRVVDSGGIERLELVAIIFEYSTEYEIMRAHLLRDLAPDGLFSS